MSAPNKVIDVHRPVPILLDRINVVAILDMNLTAMGALAMVKVIYYFNNHNRARYVIYNNYCYCR